MDCPCTQQHHELLPWACPISIREITVSGCTKIQVAYLPIKTVTSELVGLDTFLDAVSWWTQTNKVSISTKVFFSSSCKGLRGCPPHLSPILQNEEECYCSVSGMQVCKRRVYFLMDQLCVSQKYTEALHEGMGWMKLGLTLLFCVCKRQRQMFQWRAYWECLRQRDGGRKCWMLMCFFLWVLWGILRRLQLQ